MPAVSKRIRPSITVFVSEWIAGKLTVISFLGAGSPVQITDTDPVEYPGLSMISYRFTVTICPCLYHRAAVDAPTDTYVPLILTLPEVSPFHLVNGLKTT